MIRTAWILSAYDPAKNPIEPPAPATMHADVLVCLLAGLTRIADIAQQLRRSETYVAKMLADLVHFGLATQHRMPGRGTRFAFHPTQEAGA